MKQNIILVVSFLVVVVVGFSLYSWSQSTSNVPPTALIDTSQSQLEQTPTPADTHVQTTPSTTKETSPATKHMITIKTSMGDIEFATYDSDAPNTVKNFITLAQKGFYNGVIFHRIIKGFMIQGGDPTGTGTGGPGYAFADELNPATPSYQAGYVKGVVAMANAGPNTNGSQFFIMLADYPLPNNYTIFGKVVKGQDVVDAIGNLSTGANDRPTNPPKIESVLVSDI